MKKTQTDAGGLDDDAWIIDALRGASLLDI